MIRAIVLYLLGLLQEGLDPDLQKRVQAARDKAAVLDTKYKQLLREIAESERVNAELNGQRSVNAIEKEKLETAIEQEKLGLARKLSELDALRGGDRVRVDL